MNIEEYRDKALSSMRRDISKVLTECSDELEVKYLCCEECNAEYVNDEVAKLKILSDSENATVYRCEVCACCITEHAGLELHSSHYNQ